MARTQQEWEAIVGGGYTGTLGRTPDQSEINYWVNTAMNSGFGDQELINAFNNAAAIEIAGRTPASGPGPAPAIALSGPGPAPAIAPSGPGPAPAIAPSGPGPGPGPAPAIAPSGPGPSPAMAPSGPDPSPAQTFTSTQAPAAPVDPTCSCPLKCRFRGYCS
jgi:hypothetical protein